MNTIHVDATAASKSGQPQERLDSVVVRFAGDSGDGMQLTGSEFTTSTALFGHDLATFPDYPAEIRAPAGTLYGVSAYQINFGNQDVMTAGDAPDVLVAMNPAALKVNIGELRPGGMVIVDTGSFTEKDLKKAGYDASPLHSPALNPFHVIDLDISKMTLDAVAELGLSKKDSLRCKNMWTLGLVLWMFGRKRQPIIDELERKFAKKPDIAKSNVAALNAGHAFGETAEMSSSLRRYTIERAEVPPGLYRTITGSEAMAWGLLAGAQLADLQMTFGSYPITPASPLLHNLARLKKFGVITFQAEDEIAAVCCAIGAAFAGGLGVTSSSGPGIALKTEAIGLAVATELPLIVVNSQRGGPSTGLPTKTEQSDLYQAVYGRNADTPLPVVASATPADCFDTAIEAVRLATKYMTPVIILTDGYLANAAEPWRIPNFSDYKPFPTKFRTDAEGFQPFLRDPKTLARNWAIPGTPGLEHRIGGIERDYDTGNISYQPDNHDRMTRVRADKIKGIAADIPLQAVGIGKDHGKIAVVGWGSTHGPIRQAVKRMIKEGHAVSHIHIRHIWPLPRNLGELLENFDTVLVPEMNMGQLATLLRDQYVLPVKTLNKVSGQPFKIAEIAAAIRAELGV
jgi:2-oxoglutarate/2-oxoacid ferredoxin oxidoreductase subunit alpha